jgi:hypothetical protein
MKNMDRELPAEAIEAAAEWWTNVITAPVVHDSGDPAGYGTIMANDASQKVPRLTAEQLGIFKATLKTLIAEESKKQRMVIVATDYDPCPLLTEASRIAGIDDLIFRFPWKTVLWIDERDVRVRQGYRAETKTIWPKPDLSQYSLYDNNGNKSPAEPQNVTLPTMTKDQTDVLPPSAD